MKILHLTLKKKWFDMIANGEKKEEYRELKIYWNVRLVKLTSMNHTGTMVREYKKFDAVLFAHGYTKNRRTVLVNCNGITEGTGKEYWGAKKGERYFIIKLGSILN